MLRRAASTSVRAKVSINVVCLDSTGVVDGTPFMISLWRKGKQSLNTEIRYQTRGRVDFNETVEFTSTLYVTKKGFLAKDFDLQVFSPYCSSCFLMGILVIFFPRLEIITKD